MAIHHRLENALQRAEELIAVGNQSSALQLLHDAITSRWFQHNFVILDAIVMKYVELCVDLRKGRIAKDGLHQYRSSCQNANAAGFETAIIHFLDYAQKKLESAQAEVASIEIELSSVEDLEQVGDDYLTCFWVNNSTEDKDRSGHDIITPWLRFTWEVYRILLDLCRNNAKLEPLYKMIVERAFKFCQQYERKAEFRRLSEMLRIHLATTIKYRDSQNSISLSNPVSHQIQLELRFQQLTVATEMELWHEAFRSIEDIHGLFVLARKSAKSSLVMTYYARLCRIFEMSSNYLFLGATMCKLFALAKSQKDTESMKINSSIALLSIAATPFIQEIDVTNTLTIEELEAKNSRLAHFLGLQKAPTRTSVIRELYSREIDINADENAQKLFSLFKNVDQNTVKASEVETLLLNLANTNPRYSSLIPAIYSNFVCQVLYNFSVLPSKEISFSSILEAISMPNIEKSLGLTFNLDSFILKGVRRGDFHLKINHQKGSLTFSKPCFAPIPTIDLDNVSKHAGFQKIEELIAKLKLKGESAPLGNALNVDDLARIRAEAYNNLEVEHKAILCRKNYIEKRKEILEEARRAKEKEDARERAKRIEAEREAEQTRIAEEKAKRESARREAEKNEIRKEQAAKREEEERKRKEAAARRANLEKMIAVVKRFDYLERAYRQEEIPLLQKDYEDQKKTDLVAYEERCRVIKETSKEKFESEIKKKQGLISMQSDYEVYLELIKGKRMAEYEEKVATVQEKLEEAKETRRQKARIHAQAKREAAERKAKDAAERLAKNSGETNVEASENNEVPLSAEVPAPENKTGKFVPPHMRGRQNTTPATAATPVDSVVDTSSAPASGWRSKIK